jgi:superfamily II DNA/RNA helicase
LLTKRKNKPHFIFSSPNIPNPDVYLKLTNISNDDISEKMTTSYSPVSQMKYIIDLVEKEVKVHNDYNKKFIPIAKLKENVSLTQMIKTAGKNSQNIVYCSATSKAIEYALDYANSLKTQEDNAELIALSREIKGQIHADYYLADLLTKGVAYHIGYLPADIRLRIEDLFKNGAIKTIFCTSTLIEGVNLPADNLFITSYKNGLSHMTPVEFRNLVGRVGRIEFNLYGNVFLTRIEDNVEPQKYVDLIEKEIPEQKLSLVTELSIPQRKVIVECLSQGKIELLKHPKKQSVENYALMRKFALILLKDIMSNRNSYVRKEFSSLLSAEIENKIRIAFSSKTTDDDINISSDQVENLTNAIGKGLTYPKLTYQAKVDYPQLVSFLEKLCDIFKWEKYEKSTLGHKSTKNGQHGKLRWYAVILYQWISGNGLSLIMQSAIKYKKDHPASGVEVDRKIVDFDDSIKHRNIVISDTLNAIEDVILFRIANYFLRFSSEYKRFHNIEVIPDDWYEYVEYGTTNHLTIFLQRNGFSREASTYIKQHLEYISEFNGEYKVKTELLNCPNKSICKEAAEIKYNIPELFVES